MIKKLLLLLLTFTTIHPIILVNELDTTIGLEAIQPEHNLLWENFPTRTAINNPTYEIPPGKTKEIDDEPPMQLFRIIEYRVAPHHQVKITILQNQYTMCAGEKITFSRDTTPGSEEILIHKELIDPGVTEEDFL